MPIPTAAAIELTDEERAELERWARRPTSAQALAVRSRIVLAAAEGHSNTEIARRLAISRPTVTKWRARFVQYRLDGLVDEPRPGRPRTISDEQVEQVIVKTLETTPKNATHWSTRSMAAEVGLTQNAVLRIWHAFGLAPHRQQTWKLSKDPQFIDKVRDVVGLYLDPPEIAASPWRSPPVISGSPTPASLTISSSSAAVCRAANSPMISSRRSSFSPRP